MEKKGMKNWILWGFLGFLLVFIDWFNPTSQRSGMGMPVVAEMKTATCTSTTWEENST
jgi:hypothetical protein